MKLKSCAKNLLMLSAMVGLAFPVAAKTPTIDDVDVFEAAGNYYCYPWLKSDAPALTPSPKGYTPFHIEHYGRHGSRWLIGYDQYDRALRYLEKGERNGKLTPLGQETLEAVRKISKDVRGREGELSDNGALQHRGIGKRMVENFPQVFTPATNIDAKSTVVIRSILSMFNALSGIQTKVPGVNITVDASMAEMPYMNYDDKEAWIIKHHADTTVKRDFARRHANKGEYLSRLFTDADFARDSVGDRLFTSLYSVLANTQSHSDQPWLVDKVFSPQEIKERWMVRNTDWFLHGGNSKLTKNRMPFTQAPLLLNIIESVDTAIMSSTPSVNLRYGHDTIVMPLAVLLELDNFGEEINDLEELDEKGWHDYLAVPMAGNVQLIFYRPDGSRNPDEILVKAMLNEKETTLPLTPVEGPYYKWSDFRNYFKNKINSVK